MEKKMTNLEMFIWGVQHIAKNHGFECWTDCNIAVCCISIWGDNVPTLSDVQMLCEDCKVDISNICSNGYSIDILLPTDEEGYLDVDWANAEYEKPFHEFWRKIA